jgi:hypothetical protein
MVFYRSFAEDLKCMTTKPCTHAWQNPDCQRNLLWVVQTLLSKFMNIEI